MTSGEDPELPPQLPPALARLQAEMARGIEQLEKQLRAAVALYGEQTNESASAAVQATRVSHHVILRVPSFAALHVGFMATLAKWLVEHPDLDADQVVSELMNRSVSSIAAVANWSADGAKGPMAERVVTVEEFLETFEEEDTDGD